MPLTLLEEQLNQAPAPKRKPKPVEPAVAVGISYNADLQRLVRAISKDIQEMVMPELKRSAPEYVADSWVTNITSVLRRLRDKWINSQTQSIFNSLAQKFVTEAATVNRKKFNTQMKSFGLDVYGDSPELQDYLDASLADNANLIQSIPEKYIQQVESIVMTNTRAGNRPSAIQKALTQQLGVESRRAKLIARDQSAKLAGDMNAKRQDASGIQYFQWLTSKDERVRDRHSKIANKVTKYGKGVYRWDDPPLSDKGIPIIPGGDFQCFPGESKLNNTSLCKKLYRRRYSGELTELVFDDAVVLRSTANHPILTTNGFKAAHLINSFDDIIRTSEEGVHGVEFNGKCVIPTFEQIFSAFNLLGIEGGVSPSVPGEFHGDVSDSEINIIEIDRLLMDEINPSVRKKLREFGFTKTDEMVVFNTLTCLGQVDFRLIGPSGTHGSSVRGSHLKVSLLLSHLTPLELFGFTLGTWFDSIGNDDFPNPPSSNVEVFRDCVFAFATLIHGDDLVRECIKRFHAGDVLRFNPVLFNRSMDYGSTHTMFGGGSLDRESVTYRLDRIVQKRRVGFSGHVYNLENVSNDYNTNTTMVSNCRCVGIPVLQFEVDENRRAGKTDPRVKR